MALTLSIIFSIAVAGAIQSPTLLPVPNAGFEHLLAGKPVGWIWGTGEQGSGQFACETKILHSGKHSFRVKKLAGPGYTRLTSDFVPVEAGKRYRISAWIYPLCHVRRGVYFMITQHRSDSAAERTPNAFGRNSEPFVAGQWQELSAEVAVRQGNTRIRIHCIQASGPNEICYDDFAVAAVGPEPARRYVRPAPEPIGDRAAAEAIVAQRPRAEARVQMRQGRPRLIVDGKDVPWAFHVTWGGPNLEGACISDFAAAGVRVHLVPLVLGNGLYGRHGPWLDRNHFDFTVVDGLLWRVLCSDPQGYVIFYMCCDPYPGWGAENPDDVTCDQNGLKAIVDMHPKRWGNDPKSGERFGPSLVSHRLRLDIADALRRLIAHVESSAPGKAVIGYHVAGLNDGQWFQWARLLPSDLHLADYCPAAQASFRDWLRHRYGDDVRALAKAWHQPDLTFATAAIPSGDRWWSAKVFLDPRTDQDIADYTRFYSEGVAESIQCLAGQIKQATPRSIICGTYYEDITCNSANHIALARFLESPEIDYLAGPAAYRIRMPGFQGAVRNVFGSTLLHGKTYLTEQDWRSWLSVPGTREYDFSVGRAETPQAHNAMVRRECGMMLAYGLGTWWYDMGGGWFADRQIMAGVAEASRAFHRELTCGEAPRADLAVFVSEESDSWISPRHAGTYRHLEVTNQIEELNLAAVPYRLYLLSDLGRLPIPEHRAYLFLNAYRLNDVQTRAIQDLKRDGKLLVFVHAPGIIGADDPAAAIAALTGIQTKLRGSGEMKQITVDSHHSLLANLDGQIDIMGSLPGPAFAVTDPKASALAKYVKSDDVSCAARDFGSWKSLFVGCPGISCGFANNLAHWANCWVVGEPGDAIYANQRFVTIHALFPGHKRLRLARRARVTDLTTERIVAEAADMLELDMQRGETRWFLTENE
jgi:hypothetical protein